MSEIWKDVVGFEGLYKISNLGNVFSVRKNIVMKPCISNEGYYLIPLVDRNGKRKQYTVHRLVAMAFIPNPQQLPIINHKDENKTNNCSDNLEWCTHKYNCDYNGLREKINKKIGKTVYQYSLDWELVNEFCSAREAGRILNTSFGNIANACRNTGLKSCNSYWSYTKI